MKLMLRASKCFLVLLFAICFQSGIAQQVTLTATSGTATGTFTTLKGAFDAINSGTHKGDIAIKINANTTETASASLTASAALSTSAPYYTSINIYPTITGLTISGSSLAAPLINLNGADNVTIDGRVNATGSTKDLIITNGSGAAAGTSTIRFIGDASSNTVKYCTLKGSSTDASAGVVFFSTGTTTGNDNNTITNNDITCAADAGRPLNAVFALGATGKNNESNTISNNNIYNFLNKAIASQGINIGSYNSGYTISGNSFYETASYTASIGVAYNVILINAATGAGNGFTVSGNYIGGSAALCAGTAWTKTGQNSAFTAISVTTATGTANSIQGNTIQNFNWTNAGTSDFTGISLSGATVANIGTTTGNTIGAATDTGSITFTSTTTATDFWGIYINSTDVVDCQNNTIGSITVANAATNATLFYGIYKSATAGTTTISNNTIGSTTTASSINASSTSTGNLQSVYGINNAGTGTITISGNTVANMVNATSNATAGTAGLTSGIYVSAGTTVISNNTVRNLSSANANTSITNTASVSGIVMVSAAAAGQTVSGNTIYNLSNSYASFAGGVIGMYFSGTTNTNTVNANFIHSLSVSGATSTTADLYGIKIAAGYTNFTNNIISLGGDTKTDVFGIYQTGGASNHQYFYHNTLYISGSLVSGATNTSYALYSTGTINTRYFLANIFVNARSTVSGASKHYALYIAASGGTGTLYTDYNNYYVSGTGGVLGYYGANKTTLPIVTSYDASSIATNPTFVSAGGTTASNYTPTAPGTTTASATSSGITSDYAGTTRGTYITIGAYELKLAPDAPTSLVATAGVGSAYIAFTAPTNIGGGNIMNYEYTINDGATWTAIATTLSPLFISGLTPCTNYSIKIRAVNFAGGGTASAAVAVTPQSGQFAVSWTSRTSAVNTTWISVTYGNGLFVAVANSGTGNRVMTSPDGYTWTSRTSADDTKSWSSVTYGNGLFVAVAASGTGYRLMVSTDGFNWNLVNTPADNDWFSVTYGNGMFVAVGATPTGSTIANGVMTSTDGYTWTIGISATTNAWRSVTYGNGLFVAVSSTGTGNRVMTSPDGITWTSSTSAANNFWKSVTYGNGIFVAVSSDGTNRVMTSPDGITWTSRTSAANNSWFSVTYGNGLFIAVSADGTNRVMTSPNGIDWTSRTSAANNFWTSVTYSNGMFVAVSNTGTVSRVMTSSDSFAPSSPSINSITPLSTSVSVAFTVPASAGSAAITNYEYSINNGSSWVNPLQVVTTSPFTISGLSNGTTYPIQLRAVNSASSSCASATMNTTTIIPVVPNAPTSLVATAGIRSASIAFTIPTNDGGDNISKYEYTINDGATWLAISSVSSPLLIERLTACTNYNIKIRAVNSAGGGTASAAVNVTPQNGQQAGVSWTTGITPVDNSWSTVTYGNGLFVAVANSGTGNRVMTSSDGISWTSRTSAADNSWGSIAYGKGLFVAVASDGNGNRVMTSDNGITWTSRTSAANNSWKCVTYGKGLFVAVAPDGTGNRVMTSPDGINWTSRNSAADNSWNGITYGNGLFVAVASTGTGNRVMTSPDGITWTIGNSSADIYWTSVIYGNGQFLAVSLTNSVMTSPDGFNWTTGPPTSIISGMIVAYGNGVFATVNQSGGIYTSYDGITWFDRTAPSGNNTMSLTFGNGKFVSVSYTGTGNRVMTSSELLAPSSPSINSITPSSTTASVAFTAPASAGSTAITNYEYSTDNGSTWVTRSPVSTASPLVISNLTYGSTYQVQLRAVNSAGSSCGSASMSTTIATTLPVNITHLQASKQQLGVNLEWKAENELSVEKYIIERSANGINFEAIGSTNAIGNSGATIDYRFFDALPLNGNNYYRIKSIDKSGAFLFTNIVVINLNTFVTGISVYPNPITTGSFMLKLQGMAAGQYGIQLFTNQGQQVLFKEIKHLGGSSTIKMHLPAGLSGGMYFIRYTKNNVVLKNEQLIID